MRTELLRILRAKAAANIKRYGIVMVMGVFVKSTKMDQ